MKTLVSIVGPTGVGKTALSLELARKWDTVILSCDSRQFYKGMDIGTAKVAPDVRQEIPHEFIDFLTPDQNYTAAQYAAAVEMRLEKWFSEKEYVILVGGSTLYAHAVWHGLDEIPPVKPEIRAHLNQEFQEKGLEYLLAELKEVDEITYQIIDKKNPVRVIRALEVWRSSGQAISFFHQKKEKEKIYKSLKIGLTCERKELYKRIDERTEEMLAQGLEKEVRDLLAKGYDEHSAGMKAIGYAEMIAYIQGKIPLETALSLIQQHSRNYAKRQLTFFRREQEMIWVEGGLISGADLFGV